MGDEDGNGDGGNLARNNDDGLTSSCSSPSSCARMTLFAFFFITPFFDHWDVQEVLVLVKNYTHT